MPVGGEGSTTHEGTKTHFKQSLYDLVVRTSTRLPKAARLL